MTISIPRQPRYMKRFRYKIPISDNEEHRNATKKPVYLDPLRFGAGMPSCVNVSALQNGRMEAVMWSDNPEARNWTARVFGATVKDCGRVFLSERGARASSVDVSAVKPGMVLECAADIVNDKGYRDKYRRYLVVYQKDRERIVFGLHFTMSPALKTSHMIAASLAENKKILVRRAKQRAIVKARYDAAIAARDAADMLVLGEWKFDVDRPASDNFRLTEAESNLAALS